MNHHHLKKTPLSPNTGEKDGVKGKILTKLVLQNFKILCISSTEKTSSFFISLKQKTKLACKRNLKMLEKN